MEKKMKGIKIGVIVKKKYSDNHQESVSGETQETQEAEGVYVKDSKSHEKFVQNIFSILKT